MQVRQTFYYNILPLEVLSIIFSYLDIKTIQLLFLANKHSHTKLRENFPKYTLQKYTLFFTSLTEKKLLLATKAGNYSSVVALFNDKTINIRETSKEKALQVACVYGQLDIIYFLISNGVKINTPAQIKVQTTPLFLAVDRNQEDVVKILLKQKEIRNENFAQIFIKAIENQNVDIIQSLTRYNPSLLIEESLLHEAIQRNHITFVKLYLRYLSVNVQKIFEDLVNQGEQDEMIEMLLKEHTDKIFINAIDINGKTPFSCALEKYYQRIEGSENEENSTQIDLLKKNQNILSQLLKSGSDEELIKHDLKNETDQHKKNKKMQYLRKIKASVQKDLKNEPQVNEEKDKKMKHLMKIITPAQKNHHKPFINNKKEKKLKGLKKLTSSFQKSNKNKLKQQLWCFKRTK